MNQLNEAIDSERAGDLVALTLQLQESAAAAMKPQVVGDHHFVVLPPAYQRIDITKDIEQARDEPYRKRGTTTLKSLDSLIQHAKDQGCDPTGYIYANPDDRIIVAVYNDHKHGDHPGWRDHRASYKAEYTPEFATWLGQNGHERARDQVGFAEFIEANIADLGGNGTELLTVATTLQANTGIDFKAARRLDNGQTQLQYVETINATAGADGNITIPQKFDLALRIFKNGDRYKIVARLKYRLLSGGVKFWYELDRPELAVEAAFAGYVERVSNESGYTVLIGTP